MPSVDPVAAAVRQFAAAVAPAPLVLVGMLARPGARVACCFDNVRDAVEDMGGTAEFGWYFILRTSNEHGRYLIATHHSIWNDKGSRIDLTPLHPNPGHQPIRQRGSLVFLPDPEARPVECQGSLAPLPSRFWPVDDGPALRGYLGILERDEAAACDRLYRKHGAQPLR